MFEEAIINIIKKDFEKGVSAIAREFDAGIEDIQIHMKINDSGTLTYSVFKDWKMVRPEVSFKQVMGLKLDVMGKENMLTPVILKMLIEQTIAEQQKCGCSDLIVTAFLFYRKNTICVAVHNGKDYTSIKPLSQMFEPQNA